MKELDVCVGSVADMIEDLKVNYGLSADDVMEAVSTELKFRRASRAEFNEEPLDMEKMPIIKETLNTEEKVFVNKIGTLCDGVEDVIDTCGFQILDVMVELHAEYQGRQKSKCRDWVRGEFNKQEVINNG